MTKYLKTAAMTAKKQTNAGIWYLLPNYLVRMIYLVPLLMLWRTLMSQGVEVGMTLAQMLTYTLVGNLLDCWLNLRSDLTDWLYDGFITGFFQRPMNLYGQVIAQTMGSTLPLLLFFSLPLALVSPLLGISIRPASLWFLPSLVLCVSLGFAVEFLFGALLIRTMNMRWMVQCIRSAVTWLLSGSVIPFAILPWGLGDILRYQPLGSLGGATLSIYTGLADPAGTLLLQLFWNIVLWPFAVLAFQKSRERLVSHNG